VGRLRPEEISSILKGAITDYENRVRTEEVGQVLEVGDGIARVHGLTNVMYQEMVEFEDAAGEKITGLALNLEEDNVGVIVAGDDTHIQEGNTVRRTERLASVPVGEGVLGRVIDAHGSNIPADAVPEEVRDASVLGQLPVAGSLVPANTPFLLHISAKAEYLERVKVPDVRGMSIADARAALEAAGLVVGDTPTKKS